MFREKVYFFNFVPGRAVPGQDVGREGNGRCHKQRA